MGRPASKFANPLSAVDRAFLNKVWREHPTYTVRCRAHAILLSVRGFTVTQLQSILSISRRTALAWLDRWEDRGRDGLEDAPRSGGPPKLNEQEQEVFREELRRHPRQPKRVIEAVSLSGVVPYGWQPIGERQEVSVGARGVVQVLGIFEEHGETLGYLHRGSVKGTTVAEVLDDYSHRITQPTVLILDNATVHTCNLIFDSMPAWNARGLYFYFLPTYYYSANCSCSSFGRPAILRFSRRAL
jgi:transposase